MVTAVEGLEGVVAGIKEMTEGVEGPVNVEYVVDTLGGAIKDIKEACDDILPYLKDKKAQFEQESKDELSRKRQELEIEYQERTRALEEEFKTKQENAEIELRKKILASAKTEHDEDQGSDSVGRDYIGTYDGEAFLGDIDLVNMAEENQSEESDGLGSSVPEDLRDLPVGVIKQVKHLLVRRRSTVEDIEGDIEEDFEEDFEQDQIDQIDRALDEYVEEIDHAESSDQHGNSMLKRKRVDDHAGPSTKQVHLEESESEDSEPDFGNVKDNLQAALRRIRFPSGFDTVAFAREVEETARESRRNKVKQPTSWVDRFARADNSGGKTYCFLQKMSAVKGGYLAGDSKASCKAHADDDDAICVELVRIDDEKDKSWEVKVRT